MFGLIGERLGEWLRGHPSDGTLFALQDGQLAGSRKTRAYTHLANCPACREKAVQMELDWKSVDDAYRTPGSDFVPAEDELLASIRNALRASDPAEDVLAAPQAAAFAQTEAGRRMAGVLGIYLGQRAAAALLDAGGNNSKQECLTAAGNALTELLGQKGAAAVQARISWIVDHCAESSAQSPNLGQ